MAWCRLGSSGGHWRPGSVLPTPLAMVFSYSGESGIPKNWSGTLLTKTRCPSAVVVGLKELSFLDNTIFKNWM